MAALPFELRLFVRPAVPPVPFEPRLLAALAVLPPRVDLRLLSGLAVWLLPLELGRLVVREARPVLPAERVLLGALVLRRPLPDVSPEARVSAARELCPRLAPAPRLALGRFPRLALARFPRLALARFVVWRRGDESPLTFDVRLVPLRVLPSRETNVSTAPRGASTVFRTPLATFAGVCASGPPPLRPVMRFAIVLAASCATVATPAPAAKPPAPIRRTVEAGADA